MIQNLLDFFVRKKVYFAFIGIFLLFTGRPTIAPYLSFFAAICGYTFIWLAISEEPTFKKRTLSGWIFFFTLFLLDTSWLLAHPYAYIYFVWALLSALFALPFALLSSLLLQRKTSYFSIFGFACAFSLLELSFTKIFCGFPFLSSALYFSWNLYTIQLAWAVREIGLSYLVFATNLALFRAIQQKKYSFFFLLVLFPYVTGGLLFWHRSSNQHAFDKTNPPLKCAIIHTEEKSDIFLTQTSPQTFLTNEWKKVFSYLSTLKPKSVDLIVLPEEVVPYAAEAPLFPVENLPPHLQKHPYPHLTSLEIATLLSEHFETPLLIGLEGRSFEHGKVFCYNSCYFISKKGFARYDKQLLLPFGEYIPSEKLRSFLACYGVHGSFTEGKGPVIFEEDSFRVAPLICYEEIFSSYTLNALPLNPSLFVSISSDSWFPSSFLGKEHFELARLRAVEAGRPLIRSCNMGISCSIDALGRVVDRSNTKHECVITALSLYHDEPFNLGIVKK